MSLLSMRQIRKTYPGVQALRGVDLELRAGEVHALVGENGAGKSTLIKILAGATPPDGGSIALDDKPYAPRNPIDGRRAGVAVIHQEFNLVPTLSSVDNLYLGRGGGRFGWLRRSEERRLAADAFGRLGVVLPLDAPIRDLTVAQQQIVEIARALDESPRLLVMDEPTAALSPQEADHLFALVRDLRSRGIGILYVSHRLDEIFALADRVTVLRDGAHVSTCPIGDLDRRGLIERMVGRTLDQEFPSRTSNPGEVIFEANHLGRGARVRDVSFSLRRGEIVGLTGLVGSGRTETARLLFGADMSERGTMTLRGKPYRPRGPADAIAQGVAFLTEDRKEQGLVLGLGVRENFALPNLGQWSCCGWLDLRKEQKAFGEHVAQLRIKIAHADVPARELSGGNQQKVVLAKWLQAHADVLVFDEPTRGVDVGAKFEIYMLMNELVRQGKAILMISSELPEVLGMADRIVVLNQGRVGGEIASARNASQTDIMHWATRKIEG